MKLMSVIVPAIVPICVFYYKKEYYFGLINGNNMNIFCTFLYRF